MIHVDIDPAEIGKNRTADVPIVGDCKDVIAKLHAELQRAQDEAGGVPDRSRVARGRSTAGRQTYPYRYDQPADGPLKPQFAIERLYERDARATRSSSPASASTRCGRRSSGGSTSRGRGSTRAGSARWASRCRRRSARRSAGPDKRVVAIDGDGCFQMTAQELATSTDREHPVHHRDHQQRAPRDGPAVAGALLRGALLPGLPVLRHAGLREARRGVRRRRPARRAPGRGRHRDRQGAVGHRPQRRDRLPRRLAARCASRWSRRARATTTSSSGPRA